VTPEASRCRLPTVAGDSPSVARELLAVAALPAAEIGVTLNFATPSAFVHAFRRWSGATPGIWRKQLHSRL